MNKIIGYTTGVFYLFEDTYDKALDILRKKLSNDFFIEYFDSEPLYYHGWAHVKDLKSNVDYTHFPQDGVYAHHGISLDLYRTRKHLEYLERKMKHNLISVDMFNIKAQILLDTIKNEEHKIEKNDYDKSMIWAFHIIYDDRLTDEELFPLKKYEFENEYFLGPNNADIFLRLCYGDYMKLPPMEKRVPHYGNVIFLD